MATKKAKAVDTVCTADSAMSNILDRLSKLEEKQRLLVKGLEFASKTIKPIYGQTTLGLVFDELAKKLKE